MKKGVETSMIIPLKGLPLGLHSFAFPLEQPFFDQFENQDIRDAHIEAKIDLEKQAAWLKLDVTLTGTVVRACDRCLGDITFPVLYQAPLMVKFSRTHGEEENDELIILEPTDGEIDLTQYVYDSVCVSLPLQSVHPPGQCDPEMEKKIEELSVK